MNKSKGTANNLIKLPVGGQKEVKHQKKERIRWKSPWRTLLIAVVAGYIMFFAISQQVQLSDLYGEKSKLQAELDLLLQEKGQLEMQLTKMDDAETIEKIARERLGLIKPGEKLLIITQQ
ncbi:MAG: septum formation initiator family protein [Bacillota bacterium]|nr:septum formation initiator family protein [Bacillota bacterium]